MTSHPQEDVPPPPYSEIDVYSSSARDAHAADDTARSTSSASGDVIYTPPLTPRSSHRSNFASEVESIASSAAAAYFETRPAPPLNGRPHIVHSMTIRQNSTPDSLPYPGELAMRDVRLEDWQTFTNYLMPHHSAASNEQVIDRKLQAEGIAAGNDKDDDDRSTTPARSHAEAQLGQIRSPIEVDPAQRRQNMESTVREWNDGFFGPRHVTIRLELALPNPDLNEVPAQPQEQPQMPGAWDQSFNQQTPEADRNAAGPSAASRHPPCGMFGRGPGNGRGGFRFAGINIDGDRVSIGRSFEADGRAGSVRIGGIVADGNGISINGRPMFGGAGAHPPARGGPQGGPGGWGVGHGPGGPLGSGPFGGGPSRGRPDACHGRGGHSGSPWGRGGLYCTSPHRFPHHPGDTRGPGRGRWENRDRHDRGRHRSRSSSTSSSSSRSSSVSSVGSLPNYDDLKDAQLPVAKQHLEDWLHHPDQPITKEKVKQVKEQIKAGKGSNDPANLAVDRAALRREVKDLLRAWKDLKKQQKRQHKQLRREMKHRRREEKRERRRAKREMKRAAKDSRPVWDPFTGRSCSGPSLSCIYPPMPPVPFTPLRRDVPEPPHDFAPRDLPPRDFPPPRFPSPRFPPPDFPPPRFPSPRFPPPDFPPPRFPSPRFPPPSFPPPSFSPPPFAPFSRGGAAGAVPGAWPDDHDHENNNNNNNNNIINNDNGHESGVAPGPGPNPNHAAWQTKYRAVAEMEAEVAQKEIELLALHERIAQEHAARTTSGEEAGDDGKTLSEAEKEAAAVEMEMEELDKAVERLRTEADEELAREYAADEARRDRLRGIST